MAQADSVILIPDEESPGQDIHGLDANRRLDFLHFVRARVWHQIRSDDAVAAHLWIFVRLAVIEVPAKVTAVGPILLSLVIRREKSLVVPIPDAASLKSRIGIHHIPELEEIAGAVAFGICVFT